ncbi:MAG TPA: glycosyltransferase family A protein [Blastocatellia bacterium]|nr:glycosyltransferase family A protein [Blastocatellia bacterium]
MKSIFSVILPTYNRAYVLWKAIQSVMAQTESRWELIVVNDGSTDCTLRLLEEFHDTRIRALTTSNQGPSAARNRGAEIAQAPYIAYLDSDNTWHPDFLEVMHEAIRQDDDSVLWYCGQNPTFWERTEDGNWTLISRGVEPRKQYTRQEVWRLQGPDTNCIVHRRSILDKVGGWDEKCRWIEDWDFFLRVFLQYPDKIRWVPHILTEYRQVFGTGADGLCAAARESKDEEIRGRQYLLKKWGHHPDFAAADRLSMKADDLLLMRAKV